MSADAKVYSLDGRYVAELIRLECVTDRPDEPDLVAPYPKHGDGLYVRVKDALHGELLAYCGTTEELAKYFPDATAAPGKGKVNR